MTTAEDIFKLIEMVDVAAKRCHQTNHARVVEALEQAKYNLEAGAMQLAYVAARERARERQGEGPKEG